MNTAAPVMQNSRALPLFITRENKYPAGLFMFVVAILLYLTSNHIHFFEPKLLTMSWVDLAVPFAPFSVWIYISEYVLFGAVYVICKDMLNLNKYFYSFLALQIASCLIFWAWPTTYPRDLFPLSLDLHPLTLFAFNSLRQTDTPANCCPSLHVSSVYLSSFVFIEERKKLLLPFFIWSSLIALSTLTTKQHYFIDVVTGFGMACITYWIFNRWVQYRKI